MTFKNLITGAILIIFLVSIVGLFLQEFNQVKLVIFLILIISIGLIILWYYSERVARLEKKESIFEQMEEFLNLINTPICLYDVNMKLVYFNKPFEQFTNLSKENLLNLQIGTWILNNPIYQNLSLIFFPVLIANSVKIKEKNDVEIVEVNFRDELIFDLISSKLKIGPDFFNIKIVIDKTVFAKEIKEKSEFLNLLAHHLRTPLNQLKWGLEILLQDKNIVGDSKNIVNILFRTISKAIILAESVIWLNRIESGKFRLSIEENDIEEILKSSLDLLEVEIHNKNLNVKIVLDEEAKKFYFDNRVIFLALYPLIENAVIYNKENGEININVEKLKDRPYVKITIQDTGIGFSEKDLKHLFEKYYRSPIAREIHPTGTGLGLYLSKNLIKIHKGEIAIESKKDEGTKITIELPTQKELII